MTCFTVDGEDDFNFDQVGSGGKADILFVDDNSGSMSFEQVHMADRFSTFLSALNTQSVDYRIGVITDDTTSSNNPPRTINQMVLCWMEN